MGLPLFKVPVEHETPAVKIEKVLASTRSPIRRNRNIEAHIDSPHVLRRIWRANALPTGESDGYRMTSNESVSASGDNPSSATWNSRLIRILEDDRDRLSLLENSDSQSLRFQNSGRNSSLNSATREYIGSDGTSNLITSFRQGRTSRLRRIAGRHSLLATPNVTDEFLLRIAPSTHTVERFLRVFDHSDEEARTGLEVSDVEMDETFSSERHLTTSGIVQRPHAFHQLNQDQSQLEIDRYPLNFHQTPTDQPSPRNRRLNSRVATVGENNVNRSVSDDQTPVEEASSIDTSIPEDLSSVISEPTILDKREDSQLNIDSVLEDEADAENHMERSYAQERTSSDCPRNYVDFVAALDGYIVQSEGVGVNTSNDMNHVTPSPTYLNGISDE